MENKETYICRYCGSVRKSIYSLAGHERLCEKNQTENGLVNRLLNADKLRKMTENAAKKHSLEKKEYTFKCPRCGNDFSLLLNESEYKNGKHKTYCSYKCANVRERSEETKEKIANGVKKHIEKNGITTYTRISKQKSFNTCIYCGKEIGKNKTGYCKNCYYKHAERTKRKEQEKIKRFCNDCGKEIGRNNKSGYCSKCLPKHYNEFPERIKNIKAAIRKTIEDGKHKGWISRNIESFPEKFWKNVLQNNNIDYEFNKPFMGKFLDFVICVDNLRYIDLEIDGSQHKRRQQYDIERDKFLSEHGFIIHRIEWNDVKSENGKIKMKKKIDNFLNFIKTM